VKIYFEMFYVLEVFVNAFILRIIIIINVWGSNTQNKLDLGLSLIQLVIHSVSEGAMVIKK
jgi:hypothetical protein